MTKQTWEMVSSYLLWHLEESGGMHAPQESLGFLKSQLTIFSSHRDSSGGEWQELKWRKPSEAFPHDLCTIDINHKIPSSIFQHALLKLFTNNVSMMLWSPFLPDEGDHSIIEMLQYKVCEQFEQCMSKYWARYNNHCYYDLQVVHNHKMLF